MGLGQGPQACEDTLLKHIALGLQVAEGHIAKTQKAREVCIAFPETKTLFYFLFLQ